MTMPVVDLGTTTFPLIPLRDVVVFPQMVTPLFVSRPRSIAALEQVAGSLGLDLEKFVKRVAGQDGDNKRVKAGD